MEFLKLVVRYFSYVFHIVLAIFLIAISGLSLASDIPSLSFGMLPWTGATLSYILLGAGLLGLVSVILAMRGSLRVLLLIWSAVVAVMLVKGYIFSGYKFLGPKSFQTAAYLIVASLLAVVGAAVRERRKDALKAHAAKY